MRKYSCVIALSVILAGCTSIANIVNPPTATETPTAIPPITDTPFPTNTFTPEPTLTATSTPEPTATSIPTEGPTPSGGAKWLAFSVVKRVSGEYQSLGIFRMTVDASALEPITEPGYTLLGVSPSGLRMLASFGQSLYVMGIDASNRRLLTESFYDLGDHAAYWTSDEHKIVFIEGDGTENVVLLGHPDVSETTRISQEGFNPIEVYPTHDANGVFWSSGTCFAKGDCDREALMWSSMDGTLHQTMTDNINGPITSPLGDRIVYATTDPQGRNRLEFANLDGSDSRMVFAFGNHYMDYDWSPEGNRLALIVTDRSDYSGTLLTYRYYVVNNVQVRVDELPWTLRTASELSWSNDGLQILFWGTGQDDSGFQIFMKTYDIYKARMFELPGWDQFSSTDYVYIPHVYWVP
ncbi:MAG: hypothetical protein PVI78_12950 [Anaerolineales bacterium]|jgi:Tol biopolymer transport system component